MFIIKKITHTSIALATLLALTACHPKANEVSKLDKELSCSELRTEIAKVKDVKAQICDSRGFSGRNVALGLIFWPGVVINEVTGESAENAANSRLVALQNIYADKCVVKKNRTTRKS